MCTAGKFLEILVVNSLSIQHCQYCPSGRYGDKAGLTDPACSGECLPGYYCLNGSISSMEYSCGGPEYYCPRGTSSPFTVPLGWYSSNEDGDSFLDPFHRTSIFPCPFGQYCHDGVAYNCPEGYSSNFTHISSPTECERKCLPGEVMHIPSLLHCN